MLGARLEGVWVPRVEPRLGGVPQGAPRGHRPGGSGSTGEAAGSRGTVSGARRASLLPRGALLPTCREGPLQTGCLEFPLSRIGRSELCVFSRA